MNPSFAHEREYWAQVDGAITTNAIEELQNGVNIAIDGKQYHTKRCKASIFEFPPIVPERNPPIRFRKEIPAPWIKLILGEGKNRQVRKMTATVGFPTLRLMRYRIEEITIKDILPGKKISMKEKEIYSLLFKP